MKDSTNSADFFLMASTKRLRLLRRLATVNVVAACDGAGVGGAATGTSDVVGICVALDTVDARGVSGSSGGSGAFGRGGDICSSGGRGGTGDADGETVMRSPYWLASSEMTESCVGLCEGRDDLRAGAAIVRCVCA